MTIIIKIIPDYWKITSYEELLALDTEKGKITTGKQFGYPNGYWKVKDELLGDVEAKSQEKRE